jgi:hypothetical protein
MIKSALAIMLLFLHAPFQEVHLLSGADHSPLQEVTVVSYFSGKADAIGYENFSFWVKDGKRAYIQYSYGKNAKDVLAVYLSVDSSSGQRGFKVQIPGKGIFLITPEGYKLKVTDKTGKYLKRFTWEREEPGGSVEPADTSAAACEICVRNEREAMQLIQKKFLR